MACAVALVLTASGAGNGCAEGGEGTGAGSAPRTGSARARLLALGGSGVGGELSFHEVDGGGVRVKGVISGLAPGTIHGFHIHEKGDCSAPDGRSAGGHFNPSGSPHGGLEAAKSHVGDLGNLVADSEGVATVDLVKGSARMDGSEADVVGRAVIVHAGEDDLETQPTGAAGGRIACGVITADSNPSR